MPVIVSWLLCIAIYGWMIYVIYTDVFPHKSKAARFKEELSKFVENMAKLDAPDDHVQEELCKFEDYKALKKRNKQIEKATKKYKL